MAGNHLREPLDYLYEELPPERMAEARQHLSECPECRAQMRTIRETVKIYRQAEHPIAPAGLSARTIKNALKIARDREQGQPRQPVAARERGAAFVTPPSRPPAPPPEKTPARPIRPVTQEKRETHNESEYARLKEEVLCEINRRGWRSWLFHPAWTVAASVIFVCALLIHFSPRMYKQQESIRIPAHRESFLEGPAAQLRQREKLPASMALDDVAQPTALEPPPILQEAATLNEAADIDDIPTAAPALPKMLQRAARIAMPASAAIADAPEEPVAEAKISEMERPAPAAAARVSLSPPIPARMAASDQHRVPALNNEDDAASLPAAPIPEPVRSNAKTFSVPVFPKQPSTSTESGKPEAARSQAEETPNPSPPAEAPASVLMLDGFSPDVVPQIVERPTPIDVQERVRSLSALIGMQIVSGEFEDARLALGILERYDEKAAAELRKLLLDAPAPAPRDDKVKAVIGASLPKDAPMPVDKAPPPVTPTDDIKPREPILPVAPISPAPSVAPVAPEPTAATENAPAKEVSPASPPPAKKPIEPERAPEPIEIPPVEKALPPTEPEPAAVREDVLEAITGEPEPPASSSFIDEPILPRATPEAAESLSPPRPEVTSPLGIIEPPEDPPLSKVIVPPTFEVLPEPAVPVAPPPDDMNYHEIDETPTAAADTPPPFSHDATPSVSIPSVMEPATFPDGFVHLQKNGDRHGVWVAVGSTPAPVVEAMETAKPVEAADPIPAPIPVAKPQPAREEVRPVRVAAQPPPTAATATISAQPRIIAPAPATSVRRAPSPRAAPPSPRPYLRDY